MTLSDNELKQRKSKDKEKKNYISWDSIEYLSHHDNKINQEEEMYKYNSKWVIPSWMPKNNEKNLTIDNSSELSKKSLAKIYFGLQKKHKNYEKDKKLYSPKQLEIVNKMELETKWKIKFVVDKDFMNKFNKLMGVDYRWAAISGNLVIVKDHKALEDESLLRHEAIHCKQQHDIANLLWFPLLLAGNTWRKTADHIGMLSRTIFSFISKTTKQFTWKERFTPSAVDYGTDNQATDLETYINQFNPEYLKNRKRYNQIQHFFPWFIQKQFKEIRKQQIKKITEDIKKLEQKKQEGTKINFKEEDTLIKLKKDLKQLKKITNHLENDKENHVILIEPDVLPSKKHKNSPDYDPNAQVWTESNKNKTKRIKLEKNMRNNIRKKLKKKKEELQKTKDKQTREQIKQEINAYEIFLEKTKKNKDKNRKRMKALKEKELQERQNQKEQNPKK